MKNIGSLNPEKALQKGSDIFGETIVLSVASTIVVFEYTSSSAKNKAKEEKKIKEMEAVDIELQTKLRVLDKRVQVLESRIRILGGGTKSRKEIEATSLGIRCFATARSLSDLRIKYNS